MKVVDVRTMRLEGPQQHSVGAKTGRRVVKLIVRVDADNGLYGLGEADDFMGVREAIEYIKACLVGRSPFDVRPLLSEMLYGTLPPHPTNARYDGRTFKTRVPTLFGIPVALCSPTATPTGPIVWGMSGVEIALCDLVGKALGTPVYNLLGGKFRDRVRIYLDRSSPIASNDLEAWKKMAAEVVEGGFTQMKFDAEYVAPEHTLDVWNRSLTTQQLRQIHERLNAVRQTVGWGVEICLDAHMHYNTNDAIRLANELAPLKLMWLEDPTPITNPDACAMVKENSPIPICVGEMFIAEQFRLFIDRKACDIIHPDVMFSGGLHETRKIADYAELHYLPMAMHTNGGSLATIAAAHVAAASRNFLGLEYHHIENRWVSEFVRREGVALFKDGYLPLTDAPGLGVELDPDICQQYLFPGESLF
jgi:galactonate dehydratase